jgi:hypothetical protein
MCSFLGVQTKGGETCGEPQGLYALLQHLIGINWLKILRTAMISVVMKGLP